MKTRIITVALAMSTVVAFAQKKEIRKAESAVEDGNYAEAKSFLSQAEPLLAGAKDKDKATFYVTKGKAYLGTGENIPVADLLTAADAFKEAQALGAEDAAHGISSVSVALVNSAIGDQKTENYSEASEKLIAAYQLNEADTSYLYFAASNAVNAQDYDTALKYYLQLQDLGYSGKETQYSATNKETGEVETFAKDQRDLLVKTGAYTDPQETVSESRKGEIAKNIALIYIQKGENDKAIAAMESAKAENPGDTSLLLSEADMYYKMGDMAKYKEIMEEVVKADPNNAVLYYNLGVTTGELGDIDQSIAYYKKAVEIDPTMVNAYNNMALMTIDKRNPLVEEMNNLGMSKADNKRYAELEEEIKVIYRDALVYLEKVFELDPNRVETARTMMNIYSLLGEDEKSAEFKAVVEDLDSKRAAGTTAQE